MKKENIENESVLDQPKEWLDRDVWDCNGKDVFLKEDAKNKISAVLNWIIERYNLVNVTVNITGSITSNSYSKDSDIDLHIHSPEINENNVEEMNKKLRADYEENFKDSFVGLDKIGTHPIEVYFQVNPFQDMMSVGCYDYYASKWIVGPTFQPQEYDPYGDYYDEDMEFLGTLISDIRNTILQVYEYSIVLGNSKDQQFKGDIKNRFMHALQNAQDLFDAARQNRTVMSSPKSREEALKMRDSRRWKIADSAFKLMDKFGYLAILKQIKTYNEEIKAAPETLDEKARQIQTLIGGGEDNGLCMLKEDEFTPNPDIQNGLKIVFLDFDGVIRPFERKDDDPTYEADQVIVDRIKQICDITESKIVWSTSWKNFGENDKRQFGSGGERLNPMKKLYAIFRDYVYEKDPETPVIEIEKDVEKKIYPSMSKVPEIREWIKEHVDELVNFVIFDDVDWMSGNLSGNFGKRYIRTKSKEGITKEEAEEAINILGDNTQKQETVDQYCFNDV